MQTQLFPPETGQSIYALRFKNLPLGKLRSVLPIKELALCLPNSKSKAGAKPWFSNEGKIALQFLKNHQKCSDEELRHRINTNWSLQLFCGFLLSPNQEIKDKDLIWKIRSEVAGHLDIDNFQKILIDSWKPYMKNTQLGLTDATVYESYIKYPTDVKLIWDCIEWLQKKIKFYCKELKVKRPRNKYKDQYDKHLVYSRMRKRSRKKSKGRIRQTLKLLDKMLFQFSAILEYGLGIQEYEWEIFDEDTIDEYFTIGKIYVQQKFHFEKPSESVPNRIVSLSKAYLRPIVRGKENKRVEFGAKLNTWQVSGLNFIEYLSFSAFHEGNRLKNGIAFHHRMFGKLKQLGGDGIYATNENRTHCSNLNIATCFRPKGRRTHNEMLRKQQDQVRRSIGKARATVLEGSYGNDKNHYNLRKIKARNEKTEILWIFFGMMTANGVKVVALKEKKSISDKKAA